MDLFYRDDDKETGILGGAKHLSAAAARFAKSMVGAIPFLPEAAYWEFARLLTVESLWTFCLVLAGWLVATVVGGPIGLAVNGLLVAYGVVELWEELKTLGGDLKAWAVMAYQAKNQADLDLASRSFAHALAAGGLTLLELIVTHRVFKSVQGSLRTRYPAPDWLSEEFLEAKRRRERASAAAAESQGEKAVRTGDKLIRAAEVVASGARAEGMRHTASAFPTSAVVATGVVLGVTVAAGVALAVGSSRK